MFSLYIGNTDLTADPRFSVINVDGLNPVPTTINTSANGGDGAVFNSAFLQPRNIVITVVFNGDIEDTRKAFYALFPLKSRIRLRVKNKNYDVYIYGYVEANDIALFSQRQQAQVSIICPDLFFTATTATEYAFGYQVPPSETAEHPTAIITNSGDVECGLIITINLPQGAAYNNIKIINETTNEFFQINDGIIPTIDGVKFVVNTRRGELSLYEVYPTGQVSFLSKVVSSSSWIKLVQGANRLSITATNGESSLTATATVAPLYGGV